MDCKLGRYKDLLLKLPPVNYCTLKRLILHLAQYLFILCTSDAARSLLVAHHFSGPDRAVSPVCVCLDNNL